SLRLCRRAALEALQLEDRGFGWNVEMQVRGLELGFRIVEVPVRYFPRSSGRSKISGTIKGTLKAGAGILAMTGRLWWRSRTRSSAVPGVSGESMASVGCHATKEQTRMR